jgi:hypothetical protein
VFKSLISLIPFLAILSAEAQIDPSTGLLLRPSSTSQSLDSSRYELKPRDSAPSGLRVERTKPAIEADGDPDTKKEIAKTAEPPRSEPKPKVIESKPEKNVSEDSNAIHVDDLRLNLVELDLASGLMYFDSDSQSWYRNYFGSSPVLGVQARIWLSPYFGVSTSYLTSLAGDITKSPSDSAKIAADLRFFSGTMIFRNYATNSRLSPSHSVFIGYEEDQLLVPRTEPDRIRLKNSSMVLGLGVRVPTSLEHAYKISVELAPKVSVKEESTQAQHKSGVLNASNGVRLSYTSEYVLSRGQQLFWKVSHRFDKSIYDGTTSGNDPITGGTLNGVSIERGTTLFQLGFTWAD